MTPHTHRTYVEGCYRCELGRDEVRSAERGAASVTLDTIITNALLPFQPFQYAQTNANVAMEQARAVTDALLDDWQTRPDDAPAVLEHEVWMCGRCESLRVAPIPHFAGAEEYRCPGEWTRGRWVPS